MAGGRPSKYKPEFCEQARKLCELGATDVELAETFKVGITTIKRWQSEHPEFRSALKEGKEPADDRVERSLYHKATGYTFDSEKVFQHQGSIVRAKIREHVPPDTTAMIFWLKNRRPEDWRDVRQLDVRKSPLDGLSPEQLYTLLESVEALLTEAGSGAIPEGRLSEMLASVRPEGNA